jgi:hypothetical protein
VFVSREEQDKAKVLDISPGRGDNRLSVGPTNVLWDGRVNFEPKGPGDMVTPDYLCPVPLL